MSDTGDPISHIVAHASSLSRHTVCDCCMLPLGMPEASCTMPSPPLSTTLLSQHKVAMRSLKHKPIIMKHLTSTVFAVYHRLPRVQAIAPAAVPAEDTESERPGRGRAATRSPVTAAAPLVETDERHATVRSSQVSMTLVHQQTGLPLEVLTGTYLSPSRLSKLWFSRRP